MMSKSMQRRSQIECFQTPEARDAEMRHPHNMARPRNTSCIREPAVSTTEYEMTFGVITDVSAVLPMFGSDVAFLHTLVNQCEIASSIYGSSGELTCGKIRWRQGVLDAKYLVNSIRLHPGVWYKQSVEFDIPGVIMHPQNHSVRDKENGERSDTSASVSVYSEIVSERIYICPGI